MGMELLIRWQVYRPKEKIWETIEVENERFSTNSAKEAFHEYCKKAILPSIEERAWKNRKRLSNAVFVDTENGRRQVGFTFSFRDKEDGISYLTRYVVVFSRIEESYVEDF